MTQQQQKRSCNHHRRFYWSQSPEDGGEIGDGEWSPLGSSWGCLEHNFDGHLVDDLQMFDLTRVFIYLAVEIYCMIKAVEVAYLDLTLGG